MNRVCQTSPAPSSWGRARAEWQLVWCDHHVYQRTEERGALKEAVRSLGGAMLCFNRASKFLAWLAGQSEQADKACMPFLLLADYDQARLIMNSAQQLQRLPRALMLFCENPGTMQKACARRWPLGLFASLDLVSVHQGLGSVVRKLAKVSAQQVSTQQVTAAKGTACTGVSNQQAIAARGAACTEELLPEAQWASLATPPLKLLLHEQGLKVMHSS